jgi:hypothetical protein
VSERVNITYLLLSLAYVGDGQIYPSNMLLMIKSINI